MEDVRILQNVAERDLSLAGCVAQTPCFLEVRNVQAAVIGVRKAQHLLEDARRHVADDLGPVRLPHGPEAHRLEVFAVDGQHRRVGLELAPLPSLDSDDEGDVEQLRVKIAHALDVHQEVPLMPEVLAVTVAAAAAAAKENLIAAAALVLGRHVLDSGTSALIHDCAVISVPSLPRARAQRQASGFARFYGPYRCLILCCGDDFRFASFSFSYFDFLITSYQLLAGQACGAPM